MAYKIVIKPLAEQDIASAISWYAEKSLELARELLGAIDFSINSIKTHPEHFQKRYKDIRIVFTQKFSYGIYYTLEEQLIYVHAVLHTKQNPEVGIKRI